MKHVIRTEWLKIRKYPAFWWVMGVTALTYPGVNSIFLAIYRDITEKKSQSGQIVKALIGNPFTFPEVWRTVAYFSSIFIFIPAIVVIMLITNEFTYKTNRQNIIDGWSRQDFLLAKLTDVLILSVIVTGLYTLVAFVMGSINGSGQGGQWSLAYYIGLFALQTFAQLSLAFLLGLLVRKSFIAIAFFAFYSIILEPVAVGILHYRFKTDIGYYFPMEISQRLLPKPAFFGRFDEKAYQAALDAVPYHILYTILLLLVVWGFCFWLNNKRDL